MSYNGYVTYTKLTHFLVFNLWFGVSFERDKPLACSFKQIRPRAEENCSEEDLKVGQLVMVNYNTEDKKKRGLWLVPF